MNDISNITGKYEQTFLNETTDKQAVAPTSDTTETVETERPQNDRVSLSNESKDMQIAEDSVNAISDVRQDKVNEIKQAVESGNYEIDPGKIADKMIGAIVDERI